MNFQMPQAYNMLALECPTLYMPHGFNRVYEMEFPARTYRQLPLPSGNKPVYSRKPIMYMNGNNVAVGLRMKQANGLQNGEFLYPYFGVLSAHNPLDWTTKWSAWYHNGVRVGQGSSISLSLIHISEPTRQAEISYAVFCLKKKKKKKKHRKKTQK
eukprot:TRINITY_DN15536_c0_g1_i6.p2 TRINITY_DN15536_c0_g1~~TRINITY_DN15536_c0_g1_i6.p2  ORF type:complete len:156 (-),score=44.13 TRINITY_DN15536_c0_g1_i6:13-480(-)